MKKILFVSLLSSLWLTACGQKGPLYLPLDEAGQERADQSAEVSSIGGPATGFIETPVDLS